MMPMSEVFLELSITFIAVWVLHLHPWFYVIC